MSDFEAARELRNAMGSFTTGITVITAVDNKGQSIGMTVNSFTSVSLDPPLILWCLGDSSTHCETFRQCENFNVNVLEASQELASQLFASSENNNFDQIAWHADKRGIPVLSGSLASFQCTTQHMYPGGDHTIIVGRVIDHEYTGGEPLVFAQGQYQFLKDGSKS